MKELIYRAAQAILLCSLAATLPAFAQDANPQQNDHQKQTRQDEHRAQQPAQSHARQQTNQHPDEHQTRSQNQDRSNHGATHPQQQQNYHPQQQQNYHPQQQQNYHPQQQNRDERSSQSRSGQYRANQDRDNHGRPAQWGRPPAHRGSYQFRSNDRSRLHSYYMDRLRAINRANRPVFRVGGYFPYADIGYLSPLPSDLYGTLPPPPYGYQMGYYDGYVVVYDPTTYFIASIIDLLQ